MAKPKLKTFHVEVTGETQDVWDIEAESAEDAEKIGREYFADAYGDRFENVSTVADDGED